MAPARLNLGSSKRTSEDEVRRVARVRRRRGCRVGQWRDLSSDSGDRVVECERCMPVTISVSSEVGECGIGSVASGF